MTVPEPWRRCLMLEEGRPIGSASYHAYSPEEVASSGALARWAHAHRTGVPAPQRQLTPALRLGTALHSYFLEREPMVSALCYPGPLAPDSTSDPLPLLAAASLYASCCGEWGHLLSEAAPTGAAAWAAYLLGPWAGERYPELSFSYRHPCGPMCKLRPDLLLHDPGSGAMYEVSLKTMSLSRGTDEVGGLWYGRDGGPELSIAERAVAQQHHMSKRQIAWYAMAEPHVYGRYLDHRYLLILLTSPPFGWLFDELPAGDPGAPSQPRWLRAAHAANLADLQLLHNVSQGDT